MPYFITKVHPYFIFYFSWLICNKFCKVILFFPSVDCRLFLMNDLLVMQTCLSCTPSRRTELIPGLSSSCTLITHNVWKEGMIRSTSKIDLLAYSVILVHPLWQYSETECGAITRLVFLSISECVGCINPQSYSIKIKGSCVSF